MRRKEQQIVGNFSSGAILVELIIILPLVLCLIYFLLWISINFNNAASLTVAVANGARLGATRGNLYLMGFDVK